MIKLIDMFFGDNLLTSQRTVETKATFTQSHILCTNNGS